MDSIDILLLALIALPVVVFLIIYIIGVFDIQGPGTLDIIASTYVPPEDSNESEEAEKESEEVDEEEDDEEEEEKEKEKEKEKAPEKPQNSDIKRMILPLAVCFLGAGAVNGALTGLGYTLGGLGAMLLYLCAGLIAYIWINKK